MRRLAALTLLAIAAMALAFMIDPQTASALKQAVSRTIDLTGVRNVRTVEIARGQSGDFALRAKINDVVAPMVIDTGATSVVLTYETAKAAGLPLELLDYDVPVETAGGSVHAARLTLDRIAVGKLVERSVPALVVKRGQLKSNLLGMSFLNRLESFEVRADRLTLRGYP